MKIFKFSLFLSALAFFIFACSQNSSNVQNVANVNKPAAPANSNAVVSSNSNAATSPASTPDEMSAARTLYKQHCANCHKEDGTGGEVTIEGETLDAENLTTEKMKNMKDENYVKYIENGIPDEGMPPFKGKITDAQIKSVIKFIRKEFQGK